MKIFLTGGTGFIGSHFINQAHEAGYEIVALRRSKESVPRVPLSQEPLWLDKTMSKLVPSDFSNCEAVVHLAAHSANVPYDNLENCIEHNVLAPVRMFRAATECGIKRFIVAGSCFEYGHSGERFDFIPPDAPLEPTSSYPASKAAASVAFYALACELNLELLIYRIFQVYGEGEAESRFWPSLKRAALAGEDFPMSSGEQIRDFINVKDVAKVFLQSLQREDFVLGLPVIENLGSGNPLSLGEFAREQWASFAATGDLLLGALPLRKNEVMCFVPKMPN